MALIWPLYGFIVILTKSGGPGWVRGGSGVDCGCVGGILKDSEGLHA